MSLAWVGERCGPSESARVKDWPRAMNMLERANTESREPKPGALGGSTDIWRSTLLRRLDEGAGARPKLEVVSASDCERTTPRLLA